MRFRNREEAAELLARRLDRFRGSHPLVLGIPRGGVPMARIVADRLEGDLDVMLVHKLRAPFQPELAVGAVDEAGHVYIAMFAEVLGLDERALADEKQAQLTTLRERRRRYTAVRPRISLEGRVVILVDDGLATGSTAIAAARAAKAEHAATVIIAVAVAPPTTVGRLQHEADEVVCLHTTEDFNAVGEFFEDFSEVSDDQVVKLLSVRPASSHASGRP